MKNVIIEKLDAAHARYRIHHHVPVRTVADSLEKLPFPLENYLTSVVFQIKNGAWILVGRRGTDRIDYKKLASVLGARREQVSTPSPDEVHAALGIEVGTISPIPTIEGIHVLLDSHLPPGVGLFAGSGLAGRTLEITLEEVIRVTGGKIVDIAK
ncbi:MAG: YbaK/EbsC family protein [Anaerolineae bacterium]